MQIEILSPVSIRLRAENVLENSLIDDWMEKVPRSTGIAVENMGTLGRRISLYVSFENRKKISVPMVSKRKQKDVRIIRKHSKAIKR